MVGDLIKELDKKNIRQAAQPRKSDLKFVFVHGLCGWGGYDLFKKAVSYWGFAGGDVVDYLNEQGYCCGEASVDPYGSAWDRACELYAQIAGKVVDYGKEHSSRANHDRFGRDYSQNPLIEDYENSRLVLVGHSFGGATVRLLSELLRNGSKEEMEATDLEDLSDLFKGGHKDKIFAIITLAAPTNGTTAYDMCDDVTYDLQSVLLPEGCPAELFLKENFKHNHDRKALWDYADYDMHIDNALALNSRISTFDDIYYFAYPFSSSNRAMCGNMVPDRRDTADVFLATAYYMCNYKGRTAGGIEVGEEWQSNDGMVNEISAKAPFGEPCEDYKTGMKVKTGVWYVMPTIRGDHMFIVGGVSPHTSSDIKPFYIKLLDGIIDLDR